MVSDIHFSLLPGNFPKVRPLEVTLCAAVEESSRREAEEWRIKDCQDDRRSQSRFVTLRDLAAPPPPSFSYPGVSKNS